MSLFQLLVRVRHNNSHVVVRNFCRAFSAFPGSTPKTSWQSLTDADRAAWQILGWTEDRWVDGDALPPWSELSVDQQAAAKYGLGLSAAAWEARRKENDTERQTSLQTRVSSPPAQSPPPPVRVDMPQSSSQTAPQSLLSSLSQVVWKALSQNNTAAPTTKETSPPVVVNNVETSLYLDDSPSMLEFCNWWGMTTRIGQGKTILNLLFPSLGALPCRVLKFSSQPVLVHPRSAPLLPVVREAWQGSGAGGTYLWHMIEQDVLRRYRPGSSKLRLIVVTDGDDNCSPSEYLGMGGMDPMMRTLHNAGYDIEWHVIVVGDETGLEGYEDLAGATGGTFLAVKNNFDPDSKDVRSMLDAIRNSTDEQGRRDRQLKYEEKSTAGRAGRTDWYRELPPGKVKN